MGDFGEMLKGLNCFYNPFFCMLAKSSLEVEVLILSCVFSTTTKQQGKLKICLAEGIFIFIYFFDLTETVYHLALRDETQSYNQ